MKKKVRLFSIALALLMIVPLLAAISVSADPAPEPEVPAVGYYKAYADAADGELIYKADFRGDTHWVNPGIETAAANAGWEWNKEGDPIITGIVDPETPGSATFTHTTAKNTAWGADLVDFPLLEEKEVVVDGVVQVVDGVTQMETVRTDTFYTVKFTVTRTGNTPIGLLIDGHHGGYVYAQRGRLQRNGSALSGHSYVNYDGVSGTSPSSENPSVQEFAITVSSTGFALHIKGTDGKWVQVDQGLFSTDEATLPARDTLGLYFYTYHVTTVTVSDVLVYKGVSVLAAENSAIEEGEGEGEGEGQGEGEGEEQGEATTTTKEKVTYEAPSLITTEAPATTEATGEVKKGCHSFIGTGSALLLLVSTTGIAVMSFKKRKEDE